MYIKTQLQMIHFRVECVRVVTDILLDCLIQRCEEDGCGGKSLVYSRH